MATKLTPSEKVKRLVDEIGLPAVFWGLRTHLILNEGLLVSVEKGVRDAHIDYDKIVRGE